MMLEMSHASFSVGLPEQDTIGLVLNCWSSRSSGSVSGGILCVFMRLDMAGRVVWCTSSVLVNLLENSCLPAMPCQTSLHFSSMVEHIELI